MSSRSATGRYLALLPLLAVACTTTGPTATAADIRADCPRQPDPVSMASLLPRLSRALREARANLMSSGKHDEYGAVSAVLHHCRMALIEAILSAPKQAEEASSGWLDRRLCDPFVEIRAARAGPLSAGDLSGIALTDDQGGTYPLLYLTERTDGAQIVYRLHYDGAIRTPGTTGLTRVSLRLGSRFSKPLTLTWGVSAGNLSALDRLPYLFGTARLRRLRQARRAALLGQWDAVRNVLEPLQHCWRTGSGEVSALLAASNRARAVEAPSAHTAGTDSDPLAHRLALWRRLLPAVEIGLIDGARAERIVRPLRQAAAGATSGSLTAAQAKMLATFDRELAKAVAASLADDAQIVTEQPRLAPLPDIGVRPPPAAIESDLRDRVARAAHQLVARWISADKAAPGWPTARALEELRPVLTERASLTSDGRTVAQTATVLGPGWLQPGVPEGHYDLGVADYSAVYWRGRLLQAKQGRDRLVSIARQMVKREVMAPDLPGGSAADAGPLLLLRLGLKPTPTGSAKLVPNLANRSVRVAALALAALLPRGEPEAVALATRWLESTGTRRALVLELLGELQLPGAVRAQLRGRLRQLLQREPEPDAALLRVLARLGAIDRGTLAELYQRAENLRAAIIAIAPRPLALQLVHAALSSQDRGLRRAAALRLSKLAQARDRAQMDQLRGDADPYVRAAANIWLWQLGSADALLQLGEASRADCETRELTLPSLSRAMDPQARRKLLTAALASSCRRLAESSWRLAARVRPIDQSLIEQALGSWWRSVRAMAAFSLVGARP